MVKVVNFMILPQLEKGFRVNKIPSVPPQKTVTMTGLVTKIQESTGRAQICINLNNKIK